MSKAEPAGTRRRLSFLPVLSIFSQLSGAQKPVVSLEDLGAAEDIGSESKRSIDYYDESSPRFVYVPMEGADGYDSADGLSPSTRPLNSSGSLGRVSSRKDLQGRDFWVRARVAFKSSIVTKEQLEAIRSKITILPDTDISLDGEEGEDSTGFTGAFKLEETKFAVEMREQWGKYIKEEILLLKIERQNDEIIEEQAQMERRISTSSRPSVSSAEELEVESLETMLLMEEREREAERRAGPHKLKKFPSGNDGVMAFAEAKDLDAEQNEAKERSAESERLAVPAAVYSDTSAERGDCDSDASPRNAEVASAPRVRTASRRGTETFEQALSFRDLPSLESEAAPGAVIRDKSLDLESGGEVESSWSGPAPVKTHDEQGQEQAPPLYQGGVPRSPAERHAQRAVLVRQGSGIHAAAAAAEAAHTGGKRIRRMWDRMKGVVSKAMGRRAPMSGYGSQAMDRLSRSVMDGEVPSVRRGVAWLALVRSETQELDHMSRSQYQELLQQPTDFEAEISRDIHRTFPKHEMFRERGGPGQQALFNVTKAYAVLDEEVGYCQGMGFLVAIMLMNELREEEAFSCIVYIMYRCGMRTLFLPDMDRLQVRLYQLSQLQAEYLPILNGHLEELGIKPVMYAAPWFLTLFCTSLPLPLVFRIFDVVLAEKTVAIVFKIGLILLQVSRRQIMECHEMEHVMDYMRHEIAWHLKSFPDSEVEEVMAKALRVDLPIESLLRLEAEYELLAEEANTAANEVEAAALASEAAARSWEHARVGLELRLLLALKMQARAEENAEALERQVRELQARIASDQSSAATSSLPGHAKSMTAADLSATTTTGGTSQVEQPSTATSASALSKPPPTTPTPAAAANPPIEAVDKATAPLPPSASWIPDLRETAEDKATEAPKPEILNAQESTTVRDLKTTSDPSPTEAAPKNETTELLTQAPKTNDAFVKEQKQNLSLAQAIASPTIDARIAALERQLACQIDFNQPARQYLHSDATETTSLLKAVVSLRKERAALDNALRDAERLLADRIQQENLRLTAEATSPSPSLT